MFLVQTVDDVIVARSTLLASNVVQIVDLYCWPLSYIQRMLN